MTSITASFTALVRSAIGSLDAAAAVIDDGVRAAAHARAASTTLGRAASVHGSDVLAGTGARSILGSAIAHADEGTRLAAAGSTGDALARLRTARFAADLLVP